MMDLFQIITDRMIAELEQGVIPWQKPWSGVQGAISHTTGKRYSLLNQILLGCRSGEFVTFKEAQREGGHIKKGEKASMIVFWKFLESAKRDDSGSVIIGTDGKPVMESVPFLRYYNVFHIDQCEGLHPRFAEDPTPGEHLSPDKAADQIVEDYIQRSGVKLVIQHTYYFFGAPAVTESGFIIRELSQVFRQKDEEFIHMLNQIRIGNNSRSIVNSLNQQCEKILLDKECLTITPSNKDAARINQERLSALISQEYIYRGRIEGQYKKEELPTEMMLKLKVGAQVMFLVNDKQKRWVNGTIGTVAHLTPDLIQVKVKNGTYSVNMHVWNKYRYQYDPEKKQFVRGR